jgi:hypothetical protein
MTDIGSPQQSPIVQIFSKYDPRSMKGGSLNSSEITFGDSGSDREDFELGIS